MVRLRDCRALPRRRSKPGFVAFAQRRTIGNLGLDLSVSRDRRSHIIQVRFHGELIHLAPSVRGHGYCIDLCVAACDLALDVLAASSRPCQPSWTLEAAVAADLDPRRRRGDHPGTARQPGLRHGHASGARPASCGRYRSCRRPRRRSGAAARSGAQRMRAACSGG